MRSTSPAAGSIRANRLASPRTPRMDLAGETTILGAAQLALAILLRATDRDTALAQYEAFTREVIAALPQGDFSLRLASVHESLAARAGS